MRSEEFGHFLNLWGQNVRPKGNIIQFEFDDVTMVLVYDAQADRMRVMSPIMSVDQLQDGQLMSAMEANFSHCLDARYAIGDNQVWAAFLHPLSDLTPAILQSALSQVAQARRTFGTEYSSGQLIFGGLG